MLLFVPTLFRLSLCVLHQSEWFGAWLRATAKCKLISRSVFAGMNLNTVAGKNQFLATASSSVSISCVRNNSIEVANNWNKHVDAGNLALLARLCFLSIRRMHYIRPYVCILVILMHKCTCNSPATLFWDTVCFLSIQPHCG